MKVGFLLFINISFQTRMTKESKQYFFRIGAPALFDIVNQIKVDINKREISPNCYLENKELYVI